MNNDWSDETLIRELAAARARVKQLENDLIGRGSGFFDHHPDRYRTLFENSADAILIIDGDTFTDCNQASVDMLRYDDRVQLLENHPSELSPPVQSDGRDSFEKANEMIQIALENGSHRFEWEHKRADGEIFPVEVLLTPLPNSGDSKLHVVWRDITERKKLESQLRQSQKMEAMGRLVGGIAHDFNNLLMVINGNSERLLESIDQDEKSVEEIRQIAWAGRRAADLTARLLASGRKQVLQPVFLDLNEITVRTHDLLRRLIGEDIELSTRPATQSAFVKADPGLIEQVIINLSTNARDAMPTGGSLDIEVSIHEIDESMIVDGLDLPPRRYARLRVTDTGEGMDDQVRERAFEPFFTTKPIGEGSGLGLSMVYGIVRQSGGHAIIRSDQATGTVVEIWFPTVDEPETAAVAETDEGCSDDEPSSSRETILVVEDDEAVSAVIKAMLTDEGYTVLACLSGLEALEVFADHRTEIRLVLTDVVMPHMGGPELIKNMANLGPVPPVIIASGYTADLLGTFDLLGFDAAFLQKPFDKSTLLGTVRAQLDHDKD